MKQVRNLLLVLSMIVYSTNQFPVESLKGIWSDIKSFPLFQKSFWVNLGYGFGASPTGYVYSYTVQNDSLQPIWVAEQNIISVMGGCFPEGGGWHVYPSAQGILPGQNYTKLNKEYYFEMFIKTTSDSYSNHMPYLQHSDVLYQQDCIQLETKNSKQHNYFRVYVGKEFNNGSYIYIPKAEYLGYVDMNNKKDNNSLSLGSQLSSLVIKNSMQQDYIVGFSKQNIKQVSDMNSSVCNVFAKVEKNSFATLTLFGSINSFRPGTIGIFDAQTQKCIFIVSLSSQGFEDMSYTLDIHLDNTNAVVATWQGLMSGHYDMPTNRVRDITPIDGYFWYQSAQQAGTGIDLPGSVWIVAMGNNPGILAEVQPGQAVQFQIMRPEIGQQRKIYFIYVADTNKKNVQQFVQKFLRESIGTSVLASYHQQAASIISQGNLQLDMNIESQPTTASSATIPPSLIYKAAQGSLQMNRGQFIDASTGTVGYLLGCDIFLPVGIGAVPMYYMLAPSLQTQNQLPTSVVVNLYAQQSITTAPKGMPDPIMSTYAPAVVVIDNQASKVSTQIIPSES